MPETNLAESMDESLAESLKEIQSRSKDEPDEPANEEAADEGAEEGADKPAGEAEDEGEAKKEDEPAGEEDPAGGEAGEDEPDDKGEDEALDDHLKRPPSTWRAQAKADYDKLPAHIKAEVHKRERDAFTGIEQYKEQAQFGERLNKAIQPYQAFLNSQRIPPEKAVEDALNLGYSLHTATPQKKSQILMQIAKQYGADMSAFVQQEGEPDKTAQYIQHLEQKLAAVEQRQTSFEEQASTQSITQATQQIEQFASAVDEGGNLKYPYFENVQRRMVHLLENGLAKTLEDAYDQATWEDPDTRAVRLSEQAKQEAAKRQEEAKKRAAKAEKANKANLDKKGKFDSQANPTGTIDDTLNQELERIRARDS